MAGPVKVNAFCARHSAPLAKILIQVHKASYALRGAAVKAVAELRVKEQGLPRRKAL
jgi:hypothetical protein